MATERTSTISPGLIIIASAFFPGVGLLFVPGGAYKTFALLYMGAAFVGILLTFFFGIGLLILIPTWFASIIHSFAALKSHNKQAAAHIAGKDALIADLQEQVAGDDLSGG